MNKNYDDILYHPHPISKVHPPMSMSDRAAQFAPFAALTGHHEAIQETARFVDQKVELSEDQKTDINEKLQLIHENIERYRNVMIEYFEEDDRKQGGKYICIVDEIQKIDDYEKIFLLQNGKKISFHMIYRIEFQ